MTCHVCTASSTARLLDFGPQPVSNRYVRDKDDEESLHPMELSVCPTCGTLQIDHPVPVDELRPRYKWITYNEPERHLDAVADRIASLPGIWRDSVICGISYKDDSTLSRLNRRGFTKTWRADLTSDLGIADDGAGIETLQEALTAAAVARMHTHHARPDVAIVRHVFEHAHNVRRVCESLRSLVRPGGYLVLELPDQQRALDRCDYSTVWEEHVLYFTPPVLRNALAVLGFEVVAFESHAYTLEDSLVAIVREAAPSGTRLVDASTIRLEVERASRFAERYAPTKRRYRDFFLRQREQGKIAILGAGHLTCTLLNLLGIADLVEFVVDDDGHKQGLYMPGSRLPIVGAKRLIEHQIGLCCMSVRPEIEDEVIAKNRPFIDAGGEMASIFPDSRYALPFLRSGNACQAA